MPWEFREDAPIYTQLIAQIQLNTDAIQSHFAEIGSHTSDAHLRFFLLNTLQLTFADTK